jgi:hypothetical protein
MHPYCSLYSSLWSFGNNDKNKVTKSIFLQASVRIQTRLKHFPSLSFCRVDSLVHWPWHLRLAGKLWFPGASQGPSQEATQGLACVTPGLIRIAHIPSSTGCMSPNLIPGLGNPSNFHLGQMEGFLGQEVVRGLGFVFLKAPKKTMGAQRGHLCPPHSGKIHMWSCLGFLRGQSHPDPTSH